MRLSDMKLDCSKHVFKIISEEAEIMGVRAYVIGGYVRDRILGRPSKDIDVVVEGDGPALARRVGARTGSHVAIFARFGTAMIHSEDGEEVEFVGARKESYSAWLSNRGGMVSTRPTLSTLCSSFSSS